MTVRMEHGFGGAAAGGIPALRACRLSLADGLSMRIRR